MRGQTWRPSSPTLANPAGIATVVVGVFAALNQLQIAPAIFTGVCLAVLAIIGGSAINAIGGGGVGPMRSRWEDVLAKYDDEEPRVRDAAQGSRSASSNGLSDAPTNPHGLERRADGRQHQRPCRPSLN